jgi:hypothetical protein
VQRSNEAVKAMLNWRIAQQAVPRYALTETESAQEQEEEEEDF